MERTYNNQSSVSTVKAKPKRRLSKAGEWMRDPNRDTLVINDMRAVLK